MKLLLAALGKRNAHQGFPTLQCHVKCKYAPILLK